MKTKAKKKRLERIYNFMYKQMPEEKNVGESVTDANKLIRYNHKLVKLAILEAGYEMDKNEQARIEGKEEKYCKKCEKIAEKYNCTFFYQGDPRGIMVYLIPKEEIEKAKDTIAKNYEGEIENWLKSWYYEKGIGFDYK